MRFTTVLFFLFLGTTIFAQNKKMGNIKNAQNATVIAKDVFDIARFGSVAEMKALIAINKDTINATNEKGHQPLLLACYRGNYDMAYFLMPLVKQIDANTKEGTALMACVFLDETALTEKLLQYGANANSTDNAGVTCLIMAVQNKNKTIAGLLLKHKADKNIKDKQGKTALDYAIFANNIDLITILK
jgi:uncharacterized protein